MANPDLDLLGRFLSAPHAPMPVDSNLLASALGTYVEAVDATAGVVRLRCEPGPLFIQGAGLVQGGAIAAMLDFAMAFAGLALLETGLTAASVNLTTAFLKPARAGIYFVTGTIDRRGRSLLFASARMHSENRDLVATGSSTLCILAA